MTQISPIAELEATRLLGLFKYSPDQERDDHGRFGEGSGSGEIVDRVGQKYSVTHSLLEDGTGNTQHNYDVRPEGSRGNPVASMTLDRNADHVAIIGVQQSYQRKGIGTALYNHVEQHLGRSLNPGPNLSPAARSFWRVRSVGKLLKAAPSLPPANPDDQSEAAKRARRKIQQEVNDTLGDMRDRVPGEAADAFEANDNATEAMDSINLDAFDDLATGAIPTALHDVYVNAGQKALDTLQVDDTAIVDLFNKRAADYARERGAELVGKRWVNDVLVDNPDARWCISQTTRDGLRDMIVKSYEDGKTPVQLAKQIEDSYLFSESRSQMIASTETAKASVQGTLGAWQESGVVKGKAWQMSNDHDQDDECNDNEDAGVIGLDEDFPSGDDGPPAHPRCMCAVYASLEGPDERSESVV